MEDARFDSPSESVAMQTARSVLLVALSKHYGGADVRVFQLAQALHGRRRYAVAVLSGSMLHRRLEQSGLAALALPYARSDPRHLWAIYRAIRMNRYDVVDAHNPQSQLWGLGAAHLARVPVKVWTLHNDDRMVGSAWKPGVLRYLLERGRDAGCRFVGVSQPIIDYFKDCGIPAERIHLSRNALEIPQHCEPAGLRGALGWGPETVVVGVVGRLDPIKGHAVLFQALNQLRAQWPGLRCVVIGDGPMHDALQAECARLGVSAIVHFAGFRADVPRLLAETDIFCLPSLSEGLPFAVLEAALMGVPLVLSAVGGLPDHFAHGRTARMVPPGDSEALAREVCWLLDHRTEAAHMAERAREMMREQFSPARMVAETLAIYDAP